MASRTTDPSPIPDLDAMPARTDRRIDGFFYGLFMDPDVLRASHVAPENPRRAHVDDYALRIGRRATLVPSSGARSFGMVYSLTHDELDRLYGAPGLEAYRPEAVLARSADGMDAPALCYNLKQAPRSGEANEAYAERLRMVLRELGFPSAYVASVT